MLSLCVYNDLYGINRPVTPTLAIQGVEPKLVQGGRMVSAVVYVPG